MELTVWLSILTTVAAIRVPNVWEPNDRRPLYPQTNGWIPIPPPIEKRNVPQAIFNPFKQKKPIYTSQRFPYKNIPLRQTQHNQQTAASIDSFLRNFNVDHFINSQPPVPVPQLANIKRHDPFGNFNVDDVLQDSLPVKPVQPSFQFVPKNYRDDKTHEPQPFDPERDREEVPVPERNEEEKTPVSEYEAPPIPPTRPIYPGEGKWAKKGIKHKPFISQHKYATLEDPPVKPDGYQTFVAADNSFDEKREQFREDLNSFPVNHKLGEFLPETPSEQQQQEEEEEESEEEFVPTRLYAQVRNSEDVQHLPAESDENGRLKEVIKDSKVQTVYTEEGYEDSAYDHAGHEKNAENEEGFEEFDRELEAEEKKKKPKKKHNLHKPKYHTAEYTSGDGLFTDEEIERDKKEKLSLPEDSDAEPSQHHYRSNDNVLSHTDKPRKNEKNDFISTKEVKITTAKEMGDGDMEMEINGEVRMISQPSNSSKSTQFYKKYPTVHKTLPHQEDQEVIATVEQLENITSTTGIFIEEVFNHTITTTTAPLATTQETFVGDSNLEIPVTTLATTAIPKTREPRRDPIANPLLPIDEAFSQIPPRNKRSPAEFLPKIDIDTDFISKINHTLGEPKKDTTDDKYPYYKNYKALGLNEDSPLRYAEDMRNIPRKIPGRMAFYEQAESKMICPEIASTVEPIPERILNKENEEEDDEDEESEDTIEGSESVNEEVEAPVLPRLNGLGDKIDCLKARYFGENPLDSPFFKEETVGEVKPVFKFGSKSSANEENVAEATEYEEMNSLDGEKLDTPEEVVASSETTSATTVGSLITTPNYTIELKPNNIYDQIQLLKYLPARNDDTNSTTEESTVAKDNSTAKPSVRIETTINVDVTGARAAKKLDAELLPEAEKLNRPQRIHIRRNRPLYQIFDVNKFLPTTIPPHPLHLTTTPKPQVVRMYQYKRKGPLYQIFDINKFLPTTTSIPLFKDVASTVLPKYKVISEVFYKDDIKPNEQLNVFTDVLNNIKTSSEEQMKNELHDSKTEPSNIRTTTSRQEDSYMKAYEDQEVDSNYYSSIITTKKPAIVQETTVYKIPHLTQKSNKEDEKFRLYVALKEAMKKHRLQTTSETPLTSTSMDESTEVMGLMPPKANEYKTIHTSKRDNDVFLAAPAINTNKFYVIGMKPPPLQQRVKMYSDFIKPHKKNRLRVKRSPNKPSYAELSRGRGTAEEPKEEVDDYVPHRPKNYYYDEKLGKIVYINNKKDEEPDEEAEEVIYEEVTEATTTSKPKQNPIFATATPPPAGKSFVDFVNKLKSSDGYHEIPDPEPTEKDEVKETTTTAKPASTTPPEFLNILAKVRQDSGYKQIEDEDEKKKKSATTTEPAEEVEEDEEEEEESGSIVKNSAGMQVHEIGKNFEIFDITDFIPKIKNYLPKTSVDTSKYQTIRRPQVTTDSETENSETREVSTSAVVESTEGATTKKEETEATTTTTTTTTIASTTKSARKLLPPRGRFRRPTTATTTPTIVTTTPVTTTLAPSASTVTSTSTESNPRNNFRRGRIRATTTTTTTTEKFIFDEKEDSTKVLKRRSDPDIRQDEPQNNLKEEATSVASVVEVFKKFDPRRRHGGNLRRVNDLERVEISTDNAKNQVKDAEVIATYDEKKKHGGNYRSEDDADVTDNNNDSSVAVERTRSPRLLRRKPVGNLLETVANKQGDNKPKRISRRPTKKPTVQRLTDVVPKPEAFYTDPSLASTINKMVEPLRISLDDVESFTDSSEESKDDSKSSITPRRSVVQKRRGVTTAVSDTTKKPLFIKDPNKRLYFYAPI